MFSSAAPVRARLNRRPSGPVPVAALGDHELPAVDDRIPPWPGFRVVAGGAQLHLRRAPATGERCEPALYVHGLAGSSANWTDFAGALAPWLDGEAIDLPGFGRSGPAPGHDYSIASFARVVIAYLDDRGRGPVHLFGNSMGGAVSIAVAAERPDLVRTLTLISPAVPDLRVQRPGTDAAMALFLVPGVRPLAERRLARVSPQARARGLIEVCFAHPERVPQHRLDETVADIVDRQHLPWVMEAFTASFRGLAKSYVRLGRGSAWQQMARIQAPTLVVWGTEDKLVDYALAPRVTRTIPDARLLVLPETGHVAQIEDPLMVARAFLALRASPGGASVTVPPLADDGVGI